MVTRRRVPFLSRLALAPALALALALTILPLPVAADEAAAPTGVAALLDNQAILDRVELAVSWLPPAPDGATYRAWLRSDDQTLAQLLGDLSPDETGAATLTWAQPAGEPLFINFSEALVTLETGAPEARPGPVVLRAAVDPGALTHFRRLLVRWPDSRYGTASLQGLRQLATAAEGHAAILREAAATGDLKAVHRKAEHLVNLVEGNRGASFGDLDGDGRAEDPGDGVGLLPYSWGALTHTQFAWATARDEQVAEASLAVQPAVRFALAWAGFVRDTGLELGRTRDLNHARELTDHLSTAVHRVAAAVDPGVDPLLAQVAGESELSPAYQSGLKLLQLPLVPAHPGDTSDTTAVAQTSGAAG